MADAGKIHEAIAKAGIPIAWVSCPTADSYELNFLPNATPEQEIQAREIAEAVVHRTNLNQEKLEKIKTVNDFADAKYRELISQYPVLEPLKWSYTLAEATALLDTDPIHYETVAPNLVLEAQLRNISPFDHAQTVVNKSLAFRQRCAQIAGARGKHSDRVMQLSAVEQVSAYDFSDGWG